MKILLQYLSPYRWLVALVLGLAAINIGFSMLDPIIFGKIVNLAAKRKEYDISTFLWSLDFQKPGVLFFQLAYIIVNFVIELYLLFLHPLKIANKL